LDEVAGLCGGFGQDAVVDGEEGEFEAVGDAGLVVDSAQVVFDDLLLGAELAGDLLVFAALYDEGDDLHLFGSEAVADAGADAVGGVHGSDVGALHVTLASNDAADAVDKVGAGNAAADEAVEVDGNVVGELFVVLGDENDPAAERLGAGEEGGEVRVESGGDEDGGAAEAVDGGEEFRHIFALGDDTHVVFERENTCSTSPEDRLIVGENKSIHRFRCLLPGLVVPALPSSAAGDEGGRMSTIRTTPCRKRERPESCRSTIYVFLCFLNPEHPEHNRMSWG